jgi:hypothetical protein
MPDSATLRLFPDECALGDKILCDCVPTWDENEPTISYQREPNAETWIFQRATLNLQGFERRGWKRTS